MNEFDNKNIQNMEPKKEIEVLENPEAKIFTSSSGENQSTTINTLNNISDNNNPNFNKKEKKGTKKYILLALTILLAIGVIVGGICLLPKAKKLFEKPNKVEEKKEEEKENTENKEETPEEDMVYVDFGDISIPMDPSDVPGVNSNTTDYTSIDEAVQKQEEQNSQAPEQQKLNRFDTYSGPAIFKFSAMGETYQLSQTEGTITITTYPTADNGYKTTEILKRTYEGTQTYNQSGQAYIQHVAPEGYTSQNYLLLRMMQSEKNGYYIITDSNFNIIYESTYNETNTPKATGTAIIYGKPNCSGIRSNGKKGQVYEIYKINTKTGEQAYQYNIDYNGSEPIC